MPGAGYFKAVVQCRLAFEIQAQRRVFQHCLALEGNAIVSALAGKVGLRVGLQLERHGELPVRRGHIERSCGKHIRRQNEQKTTTENDRLQ